MNAKPDLVLRVVLGMTVAVFGLNRPFGLMPMIAFVEIITRLFLRARSQQTTP